MRRSAILLVAGIVSTALANFYALFKLPPEQTLGHLYKILYVHVPPIWVAYVLFAASLIYSVLYVIRRNPRYDLAAYSAVALGVCLSGVSILLGSIFSSKAWGTYWEWSEPRMTSTLILFLAYVGYLVLRSSIGDIEKRREVSAVYAIMAFVTVPMSYVSVKMFRSLHPLPQLSPEMKYMLLATFFTNLLLFLPMLRLIYLRNVEREKRFLEVEPLGT